jgi:hypothetical protein
MPPRAVHPLQFTTPPFLKTEYANLVRVSHSPAEVVLEFARILPGEPDPVVVSRLVVTPQVAKVLLQVLGENLARFENTFGTIQFPAANKDLADQLFKPPQSPPEPPDRPSGQTE